MVKHFLFGVALLGALGAAPALADDRPISRPAPPPAAPYSWTGFYLGGEAGQRAVSSTWQGNCFEGPGGGCTHLSTPPNTESLSSAGPQLGGFVGYNWQFSPFALLGAESDIAWGHTKASIAGGFPGLPPRDTSLGDGGFESTGWSASIRGRVGFLPMPGLLIYGTGGVAFQQFSFNAHCPDDDGGSWCDEAHNETASMLRTGYTVGAGIEKAFPGAYGSNIATRILAISTICFSTTPATPSMSSASAFPFIRRRFSWGCRTASERAQVTPDG
jgi:outer membrane immunogenic protein